MTKGKLNPSEYPATTPGLNSKEKSSDIIVFMIGGVTFEEAGEVAMFNSQGFNVLLGGSTIHNSKSFLAEISQIYI
jgi:vacuolar protein sorting-associated protein 45